MKKKLTALTLLLSTAMLAAGCSGDDVSVKKTPEGKYIIFSIQTENGTEYYTADDLLKDLQDNSTAQSKLYSEISRQVFTRYADKTLTTDEKNSIAEDAKDEVDEFKADAKASAKSEGTDYDTYLENALESQGVETLDELEQLYIYNGYKEAITEDYVEDHYNYFLNKYLTSYTPFQVKHILVAANTSDTNYVNGTMTTDNARKLLNVLDRFLAGETFATIADLTDDTSSKDNGGIMPFNEAQNYVSEFRFAPYAIEVFGDQSLTDEQRYQKAADLHLINKDEDSEDYVSLEEFKESDFYKMYHDGISTISLSNIMKLKENVKANMAGGYNYTYDESGEQVATDKVTVAEQTYEMNVNKYKEDGTINEKYYEEYKLERNKIFNTTLNSHKVQYIELDGAYASQTANTATVNGKKVLADENGNPVFVAYASTGIHFMCQVWNSYAKTQEENENYFTLFDSDSTNYQEDYKDSYIGQNTNLTRTELQKNSDSLLNDITSYVSNLEYYIFDALVYSDTELESSEMKIEIEFYDEELSDLIKDYVTDRITSTDESFASSVQSSSETYAKKLVREAEAKKYIDNWYQYNG